MAPAADERDDDGEQIDDREQLNEVDGEHPHRLAVLHEKRVVRALGCAPVRIRVDREVREVCDRDEHVAGHDEAELPPRLQPAARVRDQQVDEEAGRDRAQREADRPGQRLVRGHEPRAHEPGEPDGDHQEPGAVQRPPRARDQAGGYERAADERREDGLQPRHVLVFAEVHQRRGRNPDDHCRRRDEKPEARRPAHSSSASRAGPDRSAFVMKPRAPLRSTSGPKSPESRLEIRMTAAGLPFRPSALATSNPSMSGR